MRHHMTLGAVMSGALILALTGCGNSGGSVQSTPPATATATASASVTSQPTETPSSSPSSTPSSSAARPRPTVRSSSPSSTHTPKATAPSVPDAPLTDAQVINSQGVRFSEAQSAVLARRIRGAFVADSVQALREDQATLETNLSQLSITPPQCSKALQIADIGNPAKLIIAQAFNPSNGSLITTYHGDGVRDAVDADATLFSTCSSMTTSTGATTRHAVIMNFGPSGRTSLEVTAVTTTATGESQTTYIYVTQGPKYYAKIVTPVKLSQASADEIFDYVLGLKARP